MPNGLCAPLPGCAASASAWSTVIAFDQPGVYHYLCQVPRNGMRGRISVLPETVAPQIFVNGFEGS